jgi:hypothetical protein
MTRVLFTIFDTGDAQQIAARSAVDGASAALLDDGMLSPGAVALCARTGLTPGQLGVCDDLRPEAYAQSAAALDATAGVLQQCAAGLVEVQHHQRLNAHALAGRTTTEWSIVVVAAMEQAAPLSVDLNAFLREKGVLVCRADGSVVWEDTLAYAVGHGQVWVNLRGREAAGVVTPGAEYEEVCAALSRSLATLADEHGSRLVQWVRRRAELYRGAHAHRLPDLIVKLAPAAGFGRVAGGPVRPEGSSVTATASQVWEPGRYWVSGPGIRPGAAAAIPPAALTPLVLTLLGIAVPAECGPTPLALLNDEWRGRADTAAAALSADDEALLERRLRDLGYIE